MITVEDLKFIPFNGREDYADVYFKDVRLCSITYDKELIKYDMPPYFIEEGSGGLIRFKYFGRRDLNFLKDKNNHYTLDETKNAVAEILNDYVEFFNPKN